MDGGTVEDFADSQHAAKGGEKNHDREVGCAYQCVQALAIVSREQACEHEQQTKKRRAECGEADPVCQSIPTDSERDESHAESDRRCRHVGIIVNAPERPRFTSLSEPCDGTHTPGVGYRAACSRCFCSLPIAFLGSESTRWTARGALKDARLAAQRSRRASRSTPESVTT
jgi:hypothetical protein